MIARVLTVVWGIKTGILGAVCNAKELDPIDVTGFAAKAGLVDVECIAGGCLFVLTTNGTGTGLSDMPLIAAVVVGVVDSVFAGGCISLAPEYAGSILLSGLGVDGRPSCMPSGILREEWVVGSRTLVTSGLTV